MAQIEYAETMEKGKLKSGGLSDPRMGTVDRKIKCETCMAGMAECPGHFGHLELARLYFPSCAVSASTAPRSSLMRYPLVLHRMYVFFLIEYTERSPDFNLKHTELIRAFCILTMTLMNQIIFLLVPH